MDKKQPRRFFWKRLHNLARRVRVFGAERRPCRSVAQILSERSEPKEAKPKEAKSKGPRRGHLSESRQAG